jgi:hypothetical protein
MAMYTATARSSVGHHKAFVVHAAALATFSSG